MIEEWKDIVGYEGLYQISNYGRIINVNTGVLRRWAITHGGYCRVCLCKNGKTRMHFVHRIVWEAFVGPIPEGMQINHINEIKTDNRLDNINLLTPSENQKWGTINKRRNKKHQRRVVMCTLEGEELFTFFSIKDAAIETGIRHICECCKGTIKSAGGYKWKYSN